MSRLWQDKKEAIISALVLVVVVCVALALLMVPVLYHADRYRSELRKDARVLQELRAIDAVQGEINLVRKNYQERNLQNWVYARQNTDEISLDVQRKISGWLAASQLQRMTPVTTAMADGYAAVGVQVQFNASMDELWQVLRSIENSRPLLVVGQIRIVPQNQRRQRNQPEPPQRVAVQMTVQTFVLAEEKP